jgi:hypothetical protein
MEILLVESSGREMELCLAWALGFQTERSSGILMEILLVESSGREMELCSARALGIQTESLSGNRSETLLAASGPEFAAEKKARSVDS